MSPTGVSRKRRPDPKASTGNFPNTWREDLSGRPCHEVDPELVQSSFTLRRPARPDRAADRTHADAILRDFSTDWDVLLRFRWSTFRGATLYDAVRIAVQEQSRRLLRLHFPEVYAAQLRARRNGGLTGTFQFARLWEIAQIVRRYRIESCLELGSGASTAMFAQFFVAPSSFVTIEESSHWRDRLANIVGPRHSNYTSLLAPSVVERLDGLPTVRYETDHARYYDLVYVDGPSNAPYRLTDGEGQAAAHQYDPRGGALPCVDVERMWAQGVFPRVVAIDGRRSTIRRLMEKCRDRYDFILNSQYLVVAYGAIPSAYRYHSLFLRREAA